MRHALLVVVFGRMIASTCLAVLFGFFVVVQRFEERRLARERRSAPAAAE